MRIRLPAASNSFDRVRPPDQFPPPRKQQRRIVRNRIRQTGKLALQRVQRRHDLRIDAPRIPRQVFGRKRLRRKRPVVRRGRQRQMHLRGALPQQRAASIVAPACSTTSGAVPAGSTNPGRGLSPAGAGNARHRSEKARQLIQEPLPSVTLVCHQALQHADRGPLPARRAVIEISPRNGGIRGNRATSVRNRPISTSGFSPGCSRRNNFRMSCLSYRIDVFDCSADPTRAARRLPS